MLIELGHYALIMAGVLAALQAGFGLFGAQRRDGFLMDFSGSAALAQTLGCLIAFGALMHAYVTSDFSVQNVWQNSHADKPLLYKITGVWGNHEGSMLLWITVMALFGAAVALAGGRMPATLRARVLGLQALISLGFYAFVLLTSNPFARLAEAPIEGRGLNPLLQDPGLAFHPPLLYLGYVGTSLTFSFALAALLERRVDPAWARWVRPWALASWIFLTLGIALGSWWAYYELGWGGWWFWDPVENASLMPWLAATALLHSAIVVEKRDSLKRWTVLLAIIAFAFSILGTFLVRSGVITSVHAFANDPTRGAFILALLAVIVGGALILYALRAGSLDGGGLFAPVSREGALILNNVLLAVALVTVFLGTLYPMFLEAMGLGTVTVGNPYYQATFIPLLIPLVLVMAAGPLIPWKRADVLSILMRLRVAAVLALAAAGVAYAWGEGGPILAPIGIFCGCWLIFGAATDLVDRLRGPNPWARWRGLPRSALGAVIAHAGLGISIIGMSGDLWQQDSIRALTPGQSMSIAGFELTLDKVEPVQGPNFIAERATVTIRSDGKIIATATPSRRKFNRPPMTTSETAIRTNGLRDLYLALGERDAQTGAYALRVYYNPLVPWIWGGAMVMSLGGAISLADRRLRFGVAQTRAARPRVGASA
ncbi:MAG: heme lyase CcmF/NrfE family subunit [Elstera sp.]|jgi:cytochrome c-type biogenesis protein CcmF|uniref:heme lyase CcmF/NrfE family subunit n=1 Tax=Elstera sp. TaxID=1916664 RepID=UPI0037C0F1F6